MKFKPKHALAAAALALAGQAGAQTLTNLPATGNASVFFVSIDELAGRSYFSEMVANAGSTTTGVLRMDDLINNPTGTWTITLSQFDTFIAGSTSPLDSILSGFGGAENHATIGGGATTQTGSRRLVMSTSAGGAAPGLNNGQINTASTNVTEFHASFQGTGTGLCNSSPCIATSGSALNYAGITNPSNEGIGTQWGFPSGPSMGAVIANGTAAWDIYFAATNSLTQTLPGTVSALALHAVLDLATNTLTITGNIVPVPAAVWLLGSALLGFAGISRRKKSQTLEGAVAA